MSVAAEALKEAAHLLVDHRVMNHAVVEVLLLRRGRQFAVEQQIAGLEEVAVLGQVFDRIAAVEQDAFVAVDVGDLGFAAGGRGEAGIVGEDAGLAVKLADVQNLRTDRSLVERKRPVLVAKRQLAGLDVGAGFRVHDRILAGVAALTVRCTRPNGQNGLRAYWSGPIWGSATQCALQENRLLSGDAPAGARSRDPAAPGQL